MTAVKKLKAGKVEMRNYNPRMRVVTNSDVKQTGNHIDHLWVFCKTALWPNTIFTDREVSTFKYLISEHFAKSENANIMFQQLIERICLAKRYVNRKPGRFISKPVIYLNANYERGLAGTAEWYRSVEQQRKTVPHYNDGISMLAQSILSYCQKPNLHQMRAVYKMLQETKQYDLKQLYVNTIMQLRYFN